MASVAVDITSLSGLAKWLHDLADTLPTVVQSYNVETPNFGQRGEAIFAESHTVATAYDVHKQRVESGLTVLVQGIRTLAGGADIISKRYRGLEDAAAAGAGAIKDALAQAATSSAQASPVGLGSVGG